MLKRKFKLYLETSVFGFYYDQNSINKSKKDAVIKLLHQIRDDKFIAFTAPIAIQEIEKLKGPLQGKLLNLIKDFNVKVVAVDETEVENLFNAYMHENIVPKDYEDDARHVAYATILRVDCLVSLNLQHLANEWSCRQFNAVNLKQGYYPIIIRTPEEVVFYED
jgi:hypothetical protein